MAIMFQISRNLPFLCIIAVLVCIYEFSSGAPVPYLNSLVTLINFNGTQPVQK